MTINITVKKSIIKKFQNYYYEEFGNEIGDFASLDILNFFEKELYELLKKESKDGGKLRLKIHKIEKTKN